MAASQRSTQYAQRTYQLYGGCPPLESSLGFYAQACIVDNYTQYYVYFSDVNRAIPPNIYGSIVPFPAAIMVARARLQTALGGVVSPPVSTPQSQATLTFTEQALNADSGHMLQTAQTTGQVLIGGPDVYSSTTASFGPQYPIPANCSVIMSVIQVATGGKVSAGGMYGTGINPNYLYSNYGVIDNTTGTSPLNKQFMSFTIPQLEPSVYSSITMAAAGKSATVTLYGFLGNVVTLSGGNAQ